MNDIKMKELINLSQFSQDDLKHLAAQCIQLIKNPEQGIGAELFEAIITIVPQSCLECLVVDNIDHPSKIFLIWRDDKHCHGWHFPGSFIRFGKNFQETIQAIVARELFSEVLATKRTGINYSVLDTRGHGVAAGVYLVQLAEEPVETDTRKWFALDSIPDDILEHHREMLKEIGLI